MNKTDNQPLSDAASLKRRLHIFFLFCCAAFIFVLFVIWQIRTGTDGILGLFNGVFDRNQPVASRNITTDEIVDRAITYDKIDDQVWERAADSITSFLFNQRTPSTSLDGLQISPGDLFASGDIAGDFTSGLVVNPNSVELGSDTTGDYVAAIVAGLGLRQVANGEGTAVALDVVAGDGIALGGDGIAVKVLATGGLSVTGSGISLLNTCSDSETIKWEGASSTWICAPDIDTNTIYTAGAGLMLSGTTFSLDGSVALFKTIDASLGTDPIADSLTDTLSLASGNGVIVTGDSSADSVTFDLNLVSGGGLAINGGALTLLNSCGNGQYLAWTSGSSSWGCTSVAAAPSLFQAIAADSGSAIADSSSDTVTIVGGNGLTSTGSDVSDSVALTIDLATGSGLAFSGGALTLLNSCGSGQILKYSGGAWACAADSTASAGAYKQHLADIDNVTVGSSLTPLLTNGSGTAQSLGITITSGNEIAIAATMEATTTVATGPITYVIIRDENQDNDCATGGGDGAQIGGQMSTLLSVTGQNFTTSINFADSAPSSLTSYYQICASTAIALGATSVTDRALRLAEINL